MNKFLTMLGLTLCLTGSLSGYGGQVKAAGRTDTKIALSSSSTADSDKKLIEEARKAPGIEQCITDARKGNTVIDASVQDSGTSCPDGTYAKRVIFTAHPRCKPGEACPFFARLVATVDFDCNGNVIAQQCDNP
jgi:hypothetical protein